MAKRSGDYLEAFRGDCFPRAKAYRDLTTSRMALREPSAVDRGFGFSERHVQAAWYDPMWRPRELRSLDGEPVWVESPGVWNLEAGPDFLGAVLRVGRERRRVKGDAEIHLRASGWVQHGHADDPRYRGVRVHVTWFPGKVPPERLPPGTIQLSMQRALEANPHFSFEAMDLTAYPYAARAEVPPCSKVLRGWSVEERQALLDAAGHERLRRKAANLARRIETQGAAQALYEETMTALGYKHNKAPFRELAERVPVEALREVADGDAEAAYAVLLGVAGLLPEKAAAHWDAATRRYVRRLWDRWWKVRSRWEEECMTTDAWRVAGVRPANHPRRRLVAAAALWTARPKLEERWAAAPSGDGARMVERASAELAAVPAGPYWGPRLSLGGKRALKPTALLGASRVRAMVMNVWLPYLAAQPGIEFGVEWLEALPRLGSHQILRQAAHDLFGRDHTLRLYGTAMREQGVLQIFQDFCMNDRSRCARCPFPERLAVFRGEQG